MAKCKACGRDIIWIMSPAGKVIPCDPEPVIYWQKPKRGKWITIRLNNRGSYTGCSCCEAPIPTDTMLDYMPESESKYCYSCGAKMEVQE